jgi:hypothetical protein
MQYKQFLMMVMLEADWRCSTNFHQLQQQSVLTKNVNRKIRCIPSIERIETLLQFRGHEAMIRLLSPLSMQSPL